LITGRLAGVASCRSAPRRGRPIEL
jgi:hypothetical protein